MSENLTPTTEDVRNALRPYRVHPKEFDRWIAKVKADAWDQAVACMKYEDGTSVEIVSMVNPYRTDYASNPDDERARQKVEGE